MLANYRTGSTAFCDIVAKQTGLTNLDEIFHPLTDKHKYDQYRNSRCVVKIMPDHADHPAAKELLETAWVIGITRRDIVAQIASFYICHITQHWHDFKNSTTKNYTVEIDRLELEDQVRYIIDQDSKYRALAQQHCVTQYYYEDIESELGSSKFAVYHKPSNYSDICSAVNDILVEISNETNTSCNSQQ